ncbi:hypothetical protein NEF87_003896 [Candidatus Lokiarchaeum ossiferum]|uniref:Uncharacterized protein n=1 Tax=Candidatus Lokiarchaeum ossiferum TaxID=2951803 RepID=A0ABY6HYF3_9ARCH|nr:hypothetical protein NEF87_003896 [Candidatus Lokiarchaeum sp. B-35]
MKLYRPSFFFTYLVNYHKNDEWAKMDFNFDDNYLIQPEPKKVEHLVNNVSTQVSNNNKKLFIWIWR